MFRLWLAIGLLAFAASAKASPITVTVGDNDGYGLGIADNASVVWPGVGPSGTNYDGRSGAEAAATNGAQFTDAYSSILPGSGPNSTTVANFIFPFSGTLLSGTLTADLGDFQASTFGQMSVFFNGVAQPGLFNISDGFQNTAVHSFALSPTALANASAAGQLVVTVDRNGSGDFVAFDYLQLNGELTVPEPASMAIWGLGALGFAMGSRMLRKNRA
jgi:hypothetical protein